MLEGATGVGICAAASGIRNAKRDARIRLWQGKERIEPNIATANRIQPDLPLKDDQSFTDPLLRAASLALPVASLSQACNVGHVVASVPGIECQIFFQADFAKFGMAEGALPVIGLKRTKQLHPAGVQRIQQ
jgi:hypothetical protein